MRGGRARLIDFDDPANNDFLVVRQLALSGLNGRTIRPELVLYVNGLPLVIIELKDAANTAADLNVAIDQLGRYNTIAPELFVPNQSVADGATVPIYYEPRIVKLTIDRQARRRRRSGCRPWSRRTSRSRRCGKLLNDQVNISERTNLVQAQRFREALEKAMLGYTNKQISTAQMIAHLLELAKSVRETKRHGEELGLSNEETAFYDALAENGSAIEVMKSDQLRLMARALAELVKKMPKLDWTQRESVRADLRRKVRRLLAMYGYPPDLSENATQLVLKQAELSTEYAK
jgi:type I site-specific restriction-modification system R (restriction) subunit